LVSWAIRRASNCTLRKKHADYTRELDEVMRWDRKRSGASIRIVSKKGGRHVKEKTRLRRRKRLHGVFRARSRWYKKTYIWLRCGKKKNQDYILRGNFGDRNLRERKTFTSLSGERREKGTIVPTGVEERRTLQHACQCPRKASEFHRESHRQKNR